MNLKNGEITIDEILQNPNAAALVRQELPQLDAMVKTPMGFLVRMLSLNAAMAKARQYVSQAQINEVLERLKAI